MLPCMNLQMELVRADMGTVKTRVFSAFRVVAPVRLLVMDSTDVTLEIRVGLVGLRTLLALKSHSLPFPVPLKAVILQLGQREELALAVTTS